ncbi:MAG: hypothetical protein M1831_005958 [Alyxoria varia]|nr:MAG: hypothetical protein M1831_005958 [Alyxoria varia]
MRISIALFILSSVLPLAVFAKIGDECYTSQGDGTCQETSNCVAGFTWPNACPNDPANVKCCIKKDCPNGTCLDKAVTPCAGTFTSSLCPGGDSVQCCQKKDTPPITPPPDQTKPTDPFVSYLRQLYNLAKTHGGRNPNQLVMEWLRHKEYNTVQWKTLIGGVDDDFTKRVEQAEIAVIDTFPDPEYPGLNVKASHWGACMNGVFLKGKADGTDTNRADVTCWGGDWWTFYGEWRRDAEKEPKGGDYTRNHMANLVDDTTFKMRDFVEDADGFNLGLQLRNNPSLNIADLAKDLFKTGYKTRMHRFVSGRFGSNVQAIAEDMLFPPNNDLLVDTGRIAKIQDNGGFFVKLPEWLSDDDRNDLTAGFRDRLNTIVTAEV